MKQAVYEKEYINGKIYLSCSGVHYILTGEASDYVIYRVVRPNLFNLQRTKKHVFVRKTEPRKDSQFLTLLRLVEKTWLLSLSQIQGRQWIIVSLHTLTSFYNVTFCW